MAVVERHLRACDAKRRSSCNVLMKKLTQLQPSLCRDFSCLYPYNLMEDPLRCLSPTEMITQFGSPFEVKINVIVVRRDLQSNYVNCSIPKKKNYQGRPGYSPGSACTPCTKRQHAYGAAQVRFQPTVLCCMSSLYLLSLLACPIK